MTASRILRPLSIATTLGMFIVLIMGSAVTNTGSEHGCGKSWPLCHGQFIPQFAFSTAVEFSHRAVVGVESILVISLAVLTVFVFRRNREALFLSGLMVLFLFLQAGLGAWAVMYPQFAVVLALHFGVSLIAFASVLLTTVLIFQLGAGSTLRAHRVPDGFRKAVWAVTAYSYVVVYLGAYVRHTNADDACKGWPLCAGAVLPDSTEKMAIAFAHRLAAGLLVIAVFWLLLQARKLSATRPDLRRGATFALHAVLLQAVAGALVVWTDTDVFTALLHAALAGLTFAALAYLCLAVRRAPVSEGAAETGTTRTDRDALVPA